MSGVPTQQILLTGATGYVGGVLLPELLRRGHRVRCLVRSPEKADLPDGAEMAPGDVLEPRGLTEAMAGVDVAYYLVHSMGRGHGVGEDFAANDRRAAANFGDAARAAGVRRVIYLGGLEGPGADSEHLRSREEVARVLAARIPETVHVRAAMIIGQGSASFEILSHLVRRLPAMLTPTWVDTKSQPVAIGDVVKTLSVLAVRPEVPAEVQLGGADVLTYRAMMKRTAALVGKRAPVILPVPVLTPRLSSHWVALFTPVEVGLVRPLVDGLSAEMIVREAPPAGINDAPMGFDDAVRSALERA